MNTISDTSQSTSGSYALPIALSIGVTFAIALDNYLLGLALGIGLYFALSDSPQKT